MVRAHSTLSTAFLATWVAVQSSASELPAYRLGDVATNDVIATHRLLVVDDQATERVRNQEARKIDLFVVYSTNHAAVIEREVQLAVVRMRDEFLGLLEAAYGTHRLTPEVVESRGYQDLLDQFLATSSGPPVSEEVVSAWGEGQIDDEFLGAWFLPLRKVMNAPICPERLPGGERVDEGTKLRLLAVRDLQRFVKEEFAWSNSIVAVGTNFVPLAAARRQLRAVYSDEDSPITTFMVRQLQPNCRFDTNLTERVKQLAVSGLVQMKPFEPGEAVIQKGEVIDEQALAALSKMREHAKVVRLEQQVAVDKVAVQLLGERTFWLTGLLGGAVLLLIVVLIWAHRRQRRDLMPVLSASFLHDAGEEESLAETTIVDVPPESPEHWRRRVLEAEWSAARARALAQSNLMPHLAEQLKDHAVQQLAAEMDDMRDVQAAVAEHMAALEDRLERLHAPLQERLRTYEERISELELELAQRGEENQILLRARIEALRQQLEHEKQSARVN